MSLNLGLAFPARRRGEEAAEAFQGVVAAAQAIVHPVAAELAGEQAVAEPDREHHVEEAGIGARRPLRPRKVLQVVEQQPLNSPGERTGQPRSAAARGRSSLVSRMKARRTVASNPPHPRQCPSSRPCAARMGLK